MAGVSKILFADGDALKKKPKPRMLWCSWRSARLACDHGPENAELKLGDFFATPTPTYKAKV